MSKNENTHLPYENEPENYKQLRNQIQDLMIKVNECKKEVAQILSNDILAEEFGDDRNKIITDLNGVVRFLGNTHGFLLFDDVINNIKI